MNTNEQEAGTHGIAYRKRPVVGRPPLWNRQVTIGERAWVGNYSYSSRFQDGTGTNPEELIAAAHAGCFSMALCYVLGDAGHTPRSIETTAEVYLRMVEGAPTMQRIDLSVTAEVHGIDENDLRGLAETAKHTCAVSRALGGVKHITAGSVRLGPAT